MQRAFIFDFGGVLMKTTDYKPRHQWDDKLGLPHGSVERSVHNGGMWIQAQKGEVPIEMYWNDVANRLNISSKEVQQLAVDFYSGDTLDAKLIDFIQKLRRDSYTVALLSNDSVELRPKLMQLGISDLFNPLVISAEIGVVKPNKEAYEAVLKALNRPAPETIFIDDRLENVNGAKTLGIQGVHYTHGLDLSYLLE